MSDNWKTISARWQGNMNFLGTNSAGGSVQMGMPDADHVSPVELLLVALAGCTGMDIVSILEKKRVALTDFEVRVRGKRAETYPMVYTDIEVAYLLWGNDLQEKDVEQAIALSEEKYCSVGQTLEKTATIVSTYVLMKPGESAGNPW
jgi:putative redox protein